MNKESLIDIGLGIGMVVLQVVFFRHLMLYGMYPDAVLVFLVWYMTRRGRTAVVLMAFFTGFLLDALLDTWGLNLISKILVAFLAQPLIAENMKERSETLRIISAVFIAAVVHNLIFLLLSFAVENYAAELMFWRHWFGNAAFTAVIAGVYLLFKPNWLSRATS